MLAVQAWELQKRNVLLPPVPPRLVLAFRASCLWYK